MCTGDLSRAGLPLYSLLPPNSQSRETKATEGHLPNQGQNLGVLEQFPRIYPHPGVRLALGLPRDLPSHPPQPLRRAGPIRARPGAIFPWDSGGGGSHLESRLGGSAGRAYRPGWATAARCLLS